MAVAMSPNYEGEKVTSSHANTEMNQHKNSKNTSESDKKRTASFLPRKADLQNIFTNVGLCVILVTSTGQVTVVLALFNPLLNCQF